MFSGERLAGDVAAGGVADERGIVADQKDDRVAELLEVAELAHQHGVAQVQVGRGGIEADLDAQRAAGFAAIFQALAQIADANDLCRALLEQVHLFVYWFERVHLVIQYKFRCVRAPSL